MRRRTTKWLDGMIFMNRKYRNGWYTTFAYEIGTDLGCTNPCALRKLYLGSQIWNQPKRKINIETRRSTTPGKRVILVQETPEPL